jgi:hypothetical protein
MQILKGTGIDWRERRLIMKLYMAQSVKVRLNRGEKSSVKIGREVRQGCCLLPILFSLHSECFLYSLLYILYSLLFCDIVLLYVTVYLLCIVLFIFLVLYCVCL